MHALKWNGREIRNCKKTYGRLQNCFQFFGTLPQFIAVTLCHTTFVAFFRGVCTQDPLLLHAPKRSGKLIQKLQLTLKLTRSLVQSTVNQNMFKQITPVRESINRSLISLITPALYQNAQPSCPNSPLAITYPAEAKTMSPVGYWML